MVGVRDHSALVALGAGGGAISALLGLCGHHPQMHRKGSVCCHPVQKDSSSSEPLLSYHKHKTTWFGSGVGAID